VNLHRVARAVVGFLAALWGVGLLVASVTSDHLNTAIVWGAGGLILLGVSYAIYRSAAHEVR
jgi:hypothetical protein